MDLLGEIQGLKRDLSAVVLAHNYQPPEIQEIADFVGDSLELSVKALEVKAKFILFAGVDFMAEQAAILNENSIVLHPDPGAVCPMAQMISLNDVKKAKRAYPGAPLVIYVNSPAVVKAEADYIVTSSNALKLIESLPHDTVIFGPDKHLANYVEEKTGKEIIKVPECGYCPVHVKFNASSIEELKRVYRDAVFMAHPECVREVRGLADFIGSTSQMIKYVRDSNKKLFIVGTEIGIIHRMLKENPDKMFIPACTEAVCENMKKITLSKVYASLKNRVYRVFVERDVAARARRALENTFNVIGVEVPWRR